MYIFFIINILLNWQYYFPVLGVFLFRSEVHGDLRQMFHLSGTDNPIIGTFSNFFYSNLSLHLFSFFKILHIITTRSCGVHSRIRGVEISQVATRSTTPNGGGNITRTICVGLGTMAWVCCSDNWFQRMWWWNWWVEILRVFSNVSFNISLWQYPFNHYDGSPMIMTKKMLQNISLF